MALDAPRRSRGKAPAVLGALEARLSVPGVVSGAPGKAFAVSGAWPGTLGKAFAVPGALPGVPWERPVVPGAVWAPRRLRGVTFAGRWALGEAFVVFGEVVSRVPGGAFGALS
ncbi:hypothetical protein [Nonomuraea sp. JJY05]|uniref:hypothetical protein n=1 Tax=Nonomuraea sp. JJY05 TaxID=3350255 RepID=UPI00373E02D4